MLNVTIIVTVMLNRAALVFPTCASSVFETQDLKQQWHHYDTFHRPCNPNEITGMSLVAVKSGWYITIKSLRVEGFAWSF